MKAIWMKVVGVPIMAALAIVALNIAPSTASAAPCGSQLQVQTELSTPDQSVPVTADALPFNTANAQPMDRVDVGWQLATVKSHSGMNLQIDPSAGAVTTEAVAVHNPGSVGDTDMWKVKLVVLDLDHGAGASSGLAELSMTGQG